MEGHVRTTSEESLDEIIRCFITYQRAYLGTPEQETMGENIVEQLAQHIQKHGTPNMQQITLLMHDLE